MAGILDFKNYLQSLQAVTDIGNTFPSSQQRYTFFIEDDSSNIGSPLPSETSKWTATIQVATLIVDSIEFERNSNRPIFDNSTIIGYFDGVTTSSQLTTATITLPGNVYTGPVLPGGNFNVPITIYNITWIKGAEEYSHQLGFVQNWEPGVEIADPYDAYDFEPVNPLPSTLTLTNATGIDRIIYEDTLFLIAETDIPIDLGTENPVKFYKIVDGEEILIGQSYYVEQRATLAIDSNPDLPLGSYTFVARTGGKRQYGKQVSNQLSIDVLDGIPLLVDSSTFNPSKIYYYPGDSIDYTLSVYPDPAFTATGYSVINSTTVYLINGIPPNTSYLVEEDHFVDGINTASFITSATMVDTSLDYLNTLTNYEILSSSTSDTQFTATVLVWNTETITTNWGSYALAKYARGSHSETFNVANTITVTVTGQSFPISIIQNKENTLFDEVFEITVSTPLVDYYDDITIYAEQNSTIQVLTTANFSGQGFFTATITNLVSTGTWTLYATYPGDLGLSIVNANLPSTSNDLTHIVRSGNDLYPTPVFTYWTTGSYDYLNLWATTSTTLTNEVTFYDGETVLGTANWVRADDSVTTTVTSLVSQGGEALVGSFQRNFDNWLVYYNPTLDLNLRDYRFDKGWFSTMAENHDDYLYLHPDVVKFPTTLSVNGYRAFKYYDGTNYDLSLVTGTNVEEIADPIQVGDWNKNYAITLRSGGLPSTDPLATGDAGYPLGFPQRDDHATIDVYDIYKIDTIGDSRGYNVIGLDTSGFIKDPVVSESNPIRLYFTAPSYKLPPNHPEYNNSLARGGVTERYIDLVEYIGEVTWEKPYENAEQAEGTEPRSTITVKLFRFTPEIPQANYDGHATQFRNQDNWIDYVRSNIPDPEYSTAVAVDKSVTKWSTTFSYSEYNPALWLKNLLTQQAKLDYIQQFQDSRPTPPWYGNDYPLTFIDITTFPWSLRLDDYKQLGIIGQNSAYGDWQNYGWKCWISENLSDPVEKELAIFYNDWYATFVGGTRENSTTNDPFLEFRAEYSTSTYTATTYFNTQTATLELPAGTITSSNTLRAVWTGTRFLSTSYGKYNPVEVSITNPAQMIIEATNKSVTAYDVGSTTTSFVDFPTSAVYDTNPHFLKATVYTDPYQYPIALQSGTVEFYNDITDQLIGSAVTENGIARFSINASTLTNLTNGGFVGINAYFTNSDFTDPVHEYMSVQAVKTTYNLEPMQTLYDPTFYDVQRPYIPRFEINSFNKAELSTSSGTASITGQVSLQLPINVRGPISALGHDYVVPENDAWYFMFKSTSPTLIRIWQKYDDQELSVVQEQYLIRNPDTMTAPLSYSFTINQQTRDISEAWTNLKFYIELDGYKYPVYDTYPGGVRETNDAWASIPQESKLGWKSTINIAIS